MPALQQEVTVNHLMSLIQESMTIKRCLIATKKSFALDGAVLDLPLYVYR